MIAFTTVSTTGTRIVASQPRPTVLWRLSTASLPYLYRPSFVRLRELSSVAVANRQPHLSVYCPPIDLILRTGSSVDTSKLAS